jgi:hypothetical protein
MTSLSSNGIHTEFLQFSVPRASIYRLGAQMSVRQILPRHRPDGGHGPSGRTTVRQYFLKISRGNLSCLRAASRRDGTSSGRSHVRCK